MSNSFDPWTVAHQAPLSVGFPGKDTGVGCHFLLQGPDPGIETRFPASQADSLPTELRGKPWFTYLEGTKYIHLIYFKILRYRMGKIMLFYNWMGVINVLYIITDFVLITEKSYMICLPKLVSLKKTGLPHPRHENKLFNFIFGFSPQAAWPFH